MKIAIDLTSLADNFSGIERYAMNITKELIRLDGEGKNQYILLFKGKIHRDFKKIVKLVNVKYIICRQTNKLLFQQIVFPFYLYRMKADKYLFLAFQSPILFRHKGIYNTVHDLTCWDCPETMKRKMEIYFKLSIRNALHVSEKIVTISRFTRNRIVEKFRYDKRRIVIAYCGIADVFMEYVRRQSHAEMAGQDEIRDRSLDVKHKYHLPDQYLLCLATLEPRKNLPFLVDAYVELLGEKKVDIPLVLAGRKGWKMDEYLEHLEVEYRNKIIVTGFIDDDDLPYVYHMADCFIFPSMYEGFGMPPLEAMSVGTMVIASDVEALREVLDKAASYFSLGDKEGLKEKLRAGMRQECSDITVGEVRKRVNKFQWSKAAGKIAGMLECGPLSVANKFNRNI